MSRFERVSPLALVYFVGRTLVQLVRHAVNLLPLAVIVVTGGEQLRSLALWVVPVGAPVLIILYATAAWWVFRYRIEGHTLHVRDGIFRRKQLTLDYERIQQADVRQPWYFRPVGLAILGVESAGSEGREVELAGLTWQRATELKQAMLAQSTDAADQQARSEMQTADLQICLPLREVARYGIVYNPVLLIFPVIFYVLSQLDLIDDVLWPRLEELVSTINNGAGIAQYGLLVGSLAVLALVCLVAISVVIAIVRYHGFTLTVTGQRYQTRAGLLTIVTRGFQYVRLQRLVWKQGMMARLLNRKGLRIDQSGRPDSRMQGKAFFVPILDPAREQQLSQSLQLSVPVWQSVHPASMVVPWLFTTLIIVAGVAAVSGQDGSLIVHAVWVGALLAGMLMWLSWRRRAVSLDDDWLVIRHGLIGQQQHWIPASKMQTLRIRQGPWLRLWGVSALHVYSAAGRETIAWLPSEQIQSYYERLLVRTGEYQGRWM
tara:strand:+ start:8323 stop:9786 length:1464 start_codon:yes stop_codon:yes gene_type:complete